MKVALLGFALGMAFMALIAMILKMVGVLPNEASRIIWGIGMGLWAISFGVSLFIDD